MNTIDLFFGHGQNLNVLQMCVRTFVTFIILLILIRIAGRRTFAKRSAFDSIVTIMLGAIIARGVVGASPYIPTLAACIVIVGLHRLMAWLSVKSKKFEQIVKGVYIKLYQNGAIIGNNLEKTGMSENDLHESLRLETKKLTLAEIDTAFIETNGRISFILKDNSK
jgi:uncharacterized membrane protein YcaP (DUF421 family)